MPELLQIFTLILVSVFLLTGQLIRTDYRILWFIINLDLKNCILSWVFFHNSLANDYPFYVQKHLSF